MFQELLDKKLWKRPPEIYDLLEYWEEEFPKCAEPMEGLEQVLAYFSEKGIKLGVITNGTSYFQNTKVDKLNIRKYMKVILISEEVGMKKPDAEIFQLGLKRMETEKDRTIFVGDHPVIDVKGALEAGLTTVWLSHGKEWEDVLYKPDYVVCQLNDLIKQL